MNPVLHSARVACRPRLQQRELLIALASWTCNGVGLKGRYPRSRSTFFFRFCESLRYSLWNFAWPTSWAHLQLLVAFGRGWGPLYSFLTGWCCSWILSCCFSSPRTLRYITYIWTKFLPAMLHSRALISDSTPATMAGHGFHELH